MMSNVTATDAIAPDAANPELDLALKTLRISGREFEVPRTGVTAVVGGNNVGKSTLLREINEWMKQSPGSPPDPNHRRVLEGLTFDRSGSTESLYAWLRNNASEVNQPVHGFKRLSASVLDSASIAHYWGLPTLGMLAPFFVHYSEALTRSQMVEPVGPRPDITSPPDHPIHVLEDDADLLKTLDGVSQDIFRKPLTLDRLSGLTFLRVGQPAVDAPPVDAVTSEYRAALGKLPPLSSQGDGMRSLLGLLLPVLTSTYPVILVDEPEAFLHPPQAFQLGKTLAILARDKGTQVLLATHDRNLLAGLLAAEAPVSVLRLDREDDTTTAYQLPATEVASLWSDPVMRYSNVLEGLFHRVVIVAEADPDCRFFQAAIDDLDQTTELSISPSEVLFVPSGGKDGMAKIVRALRAASVRVITSPDLDLLDDQGKVKTLVEAHGGDWQQYAEDYAKAVHDLRASRVEATCGQVVAQVQDALSQVLDQPWTEETKKLLRPALRTSQSEFKKLKRFGTSTFTGQAAVHAENLLQELDNIGICCLRDGELERLAPTLGVSKGPAWLPAALAANAHQNPATRTHVQRLLQAANV